MIFHLSLQKHLKSDINPSKIEKTNFLDKMKRIHILRLISEFDELCDFCFNTDHKKVEPTDFRKVLKILLELSPLPIETIGNYIEKQKLLQNCSPDIPNVSIQWLYESLLKNSILPFSSFYYKKHDK